jgi:predicted ester cyclase
VAGLVSYLRTAFPDFRTEIEDVLVDGERTAVRWKATGTQSGQFGDLGPTGRVATWTGIDLIRLRGDRIVELWGNTDSLGLRQQLMA